MSKRPAENDHPCDRCGAKPGRRSRIGVLCVKCLKDFTRCDACGRDITAITEHYRHGFRMSLVNEKIESDGKGDCTMDTSGPWLDYDRHFCDPICFRVWMQKEVAEYMIRDAKIEAK